MIFLTVGTQPQPFRRLFNKIEELVENGIIKEQVVAQTGSNMIKSKKIVSFNYLPQDEMCSYIQRARLIISHGGVGSIITALKMGKKVIGIPRLAKYGEHINNHQVDLINVLSKKKLIIPLWDIDMLEQAIIKSENFSPLPFISGQEEMINDIRNFINH